MIMLLPKLVHRSYYKVDFNRKRKKEETQSIKFGTVRFKGMTSKSKVPLYKDSSKSSKRVGKMIANDEMTIIEEIEAGKEKWYKLESTEAMPTGWIQAKYVTVDQE